MLFSKNILLKYINKKQFKKASNEFKKWNKCGGKVLNGLVKRRLLIKITMMQYFSYICVILYIRN